MQMYDNKEVMAFLKLLSVKGIGFREMQKFCKSDKPLSEIVKESDYEKLKEYLTNIPIRSVETKTTELIDRKPHLNLIAGVTSTKLSDNKISLIFQDEPAYPKLLKKIVSPPLWLFCQGNTSLLDIPSVAIVGTRTPSEDGVFLAKCLTYLLRGTGIPIISGLAEGIDSEAHASAINNYLPTIAVLGNGILETYPKSSRSIREKMNYNNSCIISEFLPSEQPKREYFVMRNRIQSGLSSIVIPVEWKLKSGTSHTVNFALKQGKMVIGVKINGVETDEIRFLRENNMPIYTLPQDSPELLEKISIKLSKEEI